MGVNFTDEQKKVIQLRDRNILVSAAAGSGKTAVLVERIITRLTKDNPMLNVDELLVLTYTDAAASEMKERVLAAIEKALEEEPENVHLQQQATLIYQAQITTIHKFCMSVIRDYFHTIDLDPSFRVGEEGELKLLKKDVVEEVLEKAYQEGSAEFTNFVESFVSGKNDRELEKLILQLYELSKSYPNPRKWLKACVEQYDVKNAEELEEKAYIQEVLEDTRQCLMDILELLDYAINLCREEDGPAVYEDTIAYDCKQVKTLLKAGSFAEMQELLRNADWNDLTSCKDKSVSKKKIKQVSDVHDKYKKFVKGTLSQYFFDDIEVMLKEMQNSGKNVRVLIDLVIRFSDLYSEEKKKKNMIDFDDMEQYALQILTREEDGKLVPSAVAESYQEKFAEVMIDEYQDSNLVQETILTSVSKVSRGIYNIFMVGDVKQSIYRFRMSRPELFMEKYHTYNVDDSEKQRIDLHKNFRSRREVLESTNFIFEQIMMSEFGGIEYDETAALYVGADYEEKEGNETELLLIDAPDSNAEKRKELEAIAIAKRIKELMANHTVRDKKTGNYRNVQYKDIVIITRSPKGWNDVFSEVLSREGIPSYTNSKEGYFQTQEIQLFLQYLKILDNPRQDIPFAAVMKSMFVGVSSEELAQIHSCTEGKCLYENVCDYVSYGKDDSLRKRLQSFLEQFETFRRRVPYTAIHTLLWQILEGTGYGDYVAALPAGEQRTANLEMLVEKAIAFEGTSYKGLFNFVRYIEQLKKYDVDYGEANLNDEATDMVNLMSIHGSKGLEFPIVFIAGVGKEFNFQDARQSIVIHPDFGMGIDSIDIDLRVKSPTLLKKVIQQKVLKESKTEELRMLYVAMTRAKEKMILCGSTGNLEGDLFACASMLERKENHLPYQNLKNANSYMDWILQSLARNKCMAGLLNEYEIPVPYSNPKFTTIVPITVRKITAETLAEQEIIEQFEEYMTKEILEKWDTSIVYDENIKEQIEKQFSYQYPHLVGESIKQKLSVSELKKKAYMEEDGERAFKEEEVIPLLPKFLQESQELTGASKGTAYHKLLEVLDYARDYDEESLKTEIAEKQQNGILTEDMATCIRVNEILEFLNSTVGKRMQQAYRLGKCYAEQPFVHGVEANKVYLGVTSDEIVLVQGIIDVYFEEDGELVVLDYKTDRVHCAEDLTKKYHAQLEYYAEALESLTDKKVKEKIIYSFALQQEINL